jgi:hypothetical protein
MFSFGAGNLWGIPAVASPAVPTPVLFGTLQDVTVDISYTMKELTGQNSFPVAIGRGPGKIQCKAKSATISAQAFNALFSGLTVASGGQLTATSESDAIPGTPYEITVANAATFVDDLGVVVTATGARLTRVASTPTTGQYSVAAGVYTFAAADTTENVTISYSYTLASAGYSTTVSNSLMGQAPSFMAVLNNQYLQNGVNKIITFKLYACTSTKISFQFKNTDFTVPEMDFSAYANAAGQVYKLDVSDL